MKKIVFIVAFLLLLVGCGKPSTQNHILEYLTAQYPTENFTILSKEKLDNIPHDYNCSSNESGYGYIVKSNNTGIEFYISDYYYSRSGWCDYTLHDDYKTKAMEKYINDFGDNRIAIDTHMLKSDIRVDINKFSSINELSKVLYSFKVFYESKEPFLEGTSRYSAMIEVFIYKSDIYKGYLLLSDKKESDIYENIKEILQV